ncbi:uncharacterized protein LOC119745233 [Patiria miniata]|uniref:Uncharacterized protein n=1 Tax=Patiria miniata TaxID=46514 RepID=A0A914BN60_PATMI|nr:uncharacterized protein LOC119745233 [Patiria miniata]
MDVISLIFCFLAVPILVYIAVNLTVPDSAPLYGIYAVPGRWFSLKYHAVKLMLTLARRRAPHAGKRSVDPDEMRKGEEKLSQLDVYMGIGDDPYGHNSFYVNGSDQTGATRLIARVAIRPDGRRDVWFLLRLPGLGDLVLPRHPHCVVDGVLGQGFSGGGLDITVIEPLKKWRVVYKGTCRLGIRRDWEENDSRPDVNVHCVFTWSAVTSYYDFTTDIHPRLAAYNLAKEKWTGELLQKLKSMRQLHFEQFGTLEGVVRIGEEEERKLILTGVKDRSQGPRRWADMHSYVLNFIVLDNGICLHVGAFCFPGVASNLMSGFVMQPTGEVIPAVSVDLPLADLMEKTEDPPMRFALSMQPEVGEKLNMEVQIDDVMYFNMDSDWSVKIREGLSRFTVNGVQGRGVCEVLKRYHGGCPVPE